MFREHAIVKGGENAMKIISPCFPGRSASLRSRRYGDILRLQAF
jgi:hypothetical protein